MAMDLLQGTLDLLILRAVSLEPLHGLGVSRRIHQITGGEFDVKPGSLFPALYRLEESGWVAGTWGQSETNRRARFYRITAAGKRQLDQQTRTWQRLSGAMAKALTS
jgi:transcriptional regulator